MDSLVVLHVGRRVDVGLTSVIAIVDQRVVQPTSHLLHHVGGVLILLFVTRRFVNYVFAPALRRWSV